jgi:hypothetical protein
MQGTGVIATLGIGYYFLLLVYVSQEVIVVLLPKRRTLYTLTSIAKP